MHTFSEKEQFWSDQGQAEETAVRVKSKRRRRPTIGLSSGRDMAEVETETECQQLRSEALNWAALNGR